MTGAAARWDVVSVQMAFGKVVELDQGR
jgi:hypothetical protein